MFQFSLMTILAGTLVFALAISLVLTQLRIARMSEELRRARAELGHLNVDDPSRIHFAAVPLPDTMRWRWRVQLPKEGKYQLNFTTVNVDSSGFSGPWLTLYVDGSQEFSLTIDCHRDHRQKWSITASSTFGSGYSNSFGPLVASHEAWLEAYRPYSISVGGKGETTSVAPDEPAELLRIQLHDANDVPTKDGILVWITRRTDRTP